LGPSVAEGAVPGINFAVFSQHATSVTLELFHSDGSQAASFPLQRDGNRTEDVWHVCIEGLPKAGVSVPAAQLMCTTHANLKKNREER